MRASRNETRLDFRPWEIGNAIVSHLESNCGSFFSGGNRIKSTDTLRKELSEFTLRDSNWSNRFNSAE